MTVEIRRMPRVAVLAALMMVAAFALTAYSFHAGHRAGCDSRAATASLFHDVIVIASTPDPGKKPKPLTPAGHLRLHKIFARIDLIRC